MNWRHNKRYAARGITGGKVEKKKVKKKTPNQLKKDCWSLYSKWLRVSYSNEAGICRCYTCGKTAHYKSMQAGHGVPGRGGYVLFLDEIIRPQCSACNIFGSGRYDVFVPKLIREIGIERYEEIVRESRVPHPFPKCFLAEKINELKVLLTGQGE